MWIEPAKRFIIRRQFAGGAVRMYTRSFVTRQALSSLAVTFCSEIVTADTTRPLPAGRLHAQAFS